MNNKRILFILLYCTFFSWIAIAQQSGMLNKYLEAGSNALTVSKKIDGHEAFRVYYRAVIESARNANDAATMNDLEALDGKESWSARERKLASRLLRTYFLTRYGNKLGVELSEMLRFRTLMPDTGSDWFAPEFVRQRQWLEKKTNGLGLQFKSFDGRMEEITLPGGDSVIAILTHSDVVSVEGQTWSSPPWEGRIVAGKVIGRGAMDDKGPIIPVLYALAALADTKWKFPPTIKLLISNGEETDWSEIQYYQERARLPQYTIGMDGTFPVTHGQKGVGLITFKSDTASNFTRASMWHIDSLIGGSWPGTIPEKAEVYMHHNLPPSDKMSLSFEETMSQWCRTHLPAKMEMKELSHNRIKITAFGKGGHAAIPQNGHNALGDLTAFLATLDLDLDAWGSLVSFVGRYVGTEYDGASLGIAYTDSVMGELTNNLGVINIINNVPTALLNPRVPQGITSSQIDSIVKSKAAEFNRLHGTVITASARVGKPHLVPVETKLVSTLLNVWSEITGNQKKPHVTGGGLQSRLFPKGVDFGPAFSQEEDRSHASDEYMTIDELKLIGELTISALVELSEH